MTPHSASTTPLSLKPTENIFCRYWVAVSFWLTGCVSTLIPKDMLALQFCFSSLAPWLTYCCCSCSLLCCFCGRDSSNQHILTASTWLCSSEKKQSQKLCSTAPLKTTKLQAVPFSAPDHTLTNGFLCMSALLGKASEPFIAQQLKVERSKPCGQSLTSFYISRHVHVILLGYLC